LNKVVWLSDRFARSAAGGQPPVSEGVYCFRVRTTMVSST
jgi:hypothetical protein